MITNEKMTQVMEIIGADESPIEILKYAEELLSKAASKYLKTGYSVESPEVYDITMIDLNLLRAIRTFEED